MNLHEAEPVRDPRVRRTRAAVLRAAFELVTERGTTAITVSEIAEAADVSRRVVYQHFGDLDTVLLEAGLDLARRELLPRLTNHQEGVDARAETLAVATHFARHQVFYHALLTGSCAFALDRGLISLLLPVNRQAVEHLHGDRLTAQAADDLAAFITGGAGSFITAWVVDGAHDPEAFTDRLIAVISLLLEVR
ncbi:TetR/AcrR family transcriptional regulator [Lentzea flava]|uniref:TetR family transcriptional regulator n=1 Tax=Lentzea flava TaxID=103732 RepID=A0ABQ2UF43_9PSEU|nr:TetR/AcrR family transcriptional regulator [Lentzea flava]MCP2201702.1 transcriptional regulator, TetR family [Lentzea flava]GGU28080.1 TetR family transcriptional regulator [Lentzea flava]